MAATLPDIRDWVMDAKEQGATHLVVACDTYDWEDYPISVMPGDDLEKVIKSHDGPNLQKVMEVYNLSMDIESQLQEKRAWHV